MDYVAISVQKSGQEKSQTYSVPFFKGMTLLAALRYIYEKLDSTLGFRNYRCGRGVCTTCIVKVNGSNVRSCCFPLEADQAYEVGPANDKVIKDLCVKL